MKKRNLIMALMFSAGLLLTNALLTPFAAHAETSTESKNYEIDGLYWDDMDNKIIAGWDEAEDKTSYKVKLFRNGKGISTYLTTNKESYDFTSYIVEKGSGNYTFYVYPTKLGKSSQKVSETLYVDGDLHADIKKAFTKKRNADAGQYRKQYRYSHRCDHRITRRSGYFLYLYQPGGHRQNRLGISQ